LLVREAVRCPAAGRNLAGIATVPDVEAENA
jgi:hypothetical protein